MAEVRDIRVDSRFGVQDPAAIAVLLRRMIEQRSMLEATVPGGGPGLLSAVLDVDERRGQVILDASPHATVERIVLAQPEVAFSARVDKVDVRFSCGPLSKIQYEGMPAYRAPLPDAMKYMQRREYFRIEVPAGHAAYCHAITPPTNDHPPREIRTRIFDISGGGLSLFIPPGAEELLTAGTRFSSARLLLPESTPINVTLRIRRNFRITRRGAMSQVCAGCEYLDLPTSAQSVIQRYLMRLDRERIARERGRE